MISNNQKQNTMKVIATTQINGNTISIISKVVTAGANACTWAKGSTKNRTTSRTNVIYVNSESICCSNAKTIEQALTMLKDFGYNF